MLNNAKPLLPPEGSPSASQLHWQEIAEGLRNGLAKRIRWVPSMSLAEVRELMATIDTAQALEVIAHTWDDFVAHRRRELEREPLPFGNGD